MINHFHLQEWSITHVYFDIWCACGIPALTLHSYFVYMWLLKRLNAMLWFLKTFQHLTKSYGFPNVPHILGIGKLDVCNNRKKKIKKTCCPPGCCPFFDTSVSSCIPLVLSMGAGSASSLLLKPSTDTKPALRVTRAHHWQVRVFINSLHDTPCVTCSVKVHAQWQ